MESMTDVQKAYAACFIDTDGWISLSLSRGKYTCPEVGFANANLEVIEDIQDWVGGRLYTWNRSGKRPSHRLRISVKEDILDLLILLSPYLRIKYEQAQLMIDYCLNEHTRGERLEIMSNIQRLNKGEIDATTS